MSETLRHKGIKLINRSVFDVEIACRSRHSLLVNVYIKYDMVVANRCIRSFTNINMLKRRRDDCLVGSIA